MEQCVGQAISLDRMSVCVMDDAGAVVAQAGTLPDPDVARPGISMGRRTDRPGRCLRPHNCKAWPTLGTALAIHLRSSQGRPRSNSNGRTCDDDLCSFRHTGAQPTRP